MTLSEVYLHVAATAVGVVSAARLTRLVVADTFPPSVAFRIWFEKVTKDGGWSKLVSCPWCAAPYISGIVLAWAVLSDLHLTWWLFNGWMAGSYAAAYLVFHDEDE